MFVQNVAGIAAFVNCNLLTVESPSDTMSYYIVCCVAGTCQHAHLNYLLTMLSTDGASILELRLIGFFPSMKCKLLLCLSYIIYRKPKMLYLNKLF